MENRINIFICESDNDFNIAKSITRDYVEWLGMDLCFQDIDKEFETFDKMYAQPNGCFIYAKYNDIIAGGVGCHKLKESICEMKRLFVYDNFQGKGTGKILCQEIITISKELGYKKMRLDTILKLDRAIRLYETFGFYDIPKYRENPDKTVRYMELNLDTK